MKRIVLLVILGLLVWAGFYLRFIDLGQKPMHTDEAVNGMRVVAMLQGEPVSFDPGHYHGPLLRYLAMPVVRVSQWKSGERLSEASLRWLTALAGGLTVLSIVLFRTYLGTDATFIALVYAAVSPPLIYYNRYFIHESIFVLFSLLFLFFLWRFREERTWASAIWSGVLGGALHATRETVVLVVIAAALALFVSAWRDWKRVFGEFLTRESLQKLGLMALAALTVSVVFYSGFFTHWSGVVDSILTYFRYETESGHEKPWYYYLSLIVGEKSRVGYLGQAWLMLFGAAGLWQAFIDKKRDEDRIPFFRYIAAYTVATTVLYSAIAYKTPWLVLNFLVGWILLSGLGWGYLWIRFESMLVRGVLVLVLLGTLGHSIRQSWLLGFRFAADPRNPFVYSHTSPDLLKLVDRLETLSRLHPDGKAMRIDIAGTEYWPLPWYLREYSGVGYWQELPENSDAPVQIYSLLAGQEGPVVDEAVYMSELRGLREGVLLLILIKHPLWERQFPGG